MAKFTQEEIVLFRALWEDKQFQQGLTKTTNQLNKLMTQLLPKKLKSQAPIIDEKQTLVAMKKIQKEERRVANERIISAKQAEHSMLRLQRGLLQAGLSIMFFGMQMRKFFEGIAQASLSTFLKLSADTEMANNTINRLSAGLEGVKFAIGDAINTALEPFEGLLSNVVDRVIDFIDTHPDVIAWGIGLGVVVGTAMELLGQISLLIIGLAAAKFAFGTAGASGVAAFGAMFKSIALFVGKLSLVLGIFYAIFGLLRNDKTVVNFFAGLIVLVSKAVAAILWALTAVGGTLGLSLRITFKAIAYAIKWIFQEAINFVIAGINKLIQGYNWVASKLGLGTIKEIGKVNFTQGGLDISQEKEQLKYLWSKESFGDWMSAAENVGEMFKSGIATITTTLGTNSQQQKIADLNLATANKEAMAAESFSNAVSYFGSIVSGAQTPSLSGGGGARASYQNGTMFYGFSDTYTNQ